MRTKALLVTAALGAVGISTSMAQVYSVNAVGYVNVDIPAKNFLIVANPLKATDNKVPALFKGVPEGFTVFKFGAAGWLINAYELGDWTDPNMTLVPGEGAFVQNPTDAKVTITFVGEVSQGSLSHDIPKGLSLQSSEVPQAGHLSTDLKFPAVEGDLVYRYNRGGQAGYTILSYELGDWTAPPNVDVAEGFWVNKAAAVAWTRTFNVN